MKEGAPEAASDAAPKDLAPEAALEAAPKEAASEAAPHYHLLLFNALILPGSDTHPFAA